MRKIRFSFFLAYSKLELQSLPPPLNVAALLFVKYPRLLTYLLDRTLHYPAQTLELRLKELNAKRVKEFNDKLEPMPMAFLVLKDPLTATTATSNLTALHANVDEALENFDTEFGPQFVAKNKGAAKQISTIVISNPHTTQMRIAFMKDGKLLRDNKGRIIVTSLGEMDIADTLVNDLQSLLASRQITSGEVSVVSGQEGKRARQEIRGIIESPVGDKIRWHPTVQKERRKEGHNEDLHFYTGLSAKQVGTAVGWGLYSALAFIPRALLAPVAGLFTTADEFLRLPVKNELLGISQLEAQAKREQKAKAKQEAVTKKEEKTKAKQQAKVEAVTQKKAEQGAKQKAKLAAAMQKKGKEKVKQKEQPFLPNDVPMTKITATIETAIGSNLSHQVSPGDQPESSAMAESRARAQATNEEDLGALIHDLTQTAEEIEATAKAAQARVEAEVIAELNRKRLEAMKVQEDEGKGKEKILEHEKIDPQKMKEAEVDLEKALADLRALQEAPIQTEKHVEENTAALDRSIKSIEEAVAGLKTPTPPSSPTPTTLPVDRRGSEPLAASSKPMNRTRGFSVAETVTSAFRKGLPSSASSMAKSPAALQRAQQALDDAEKRKAEKQKKKEQAKQAKEQEKDIAQLVEDHIEESVTGHDRTIARTMTTIDPAVGMSPLASSAAESLLKESAVHALTSPNLWNRQSHSHQDSSQTFKGEGSSTAAEQQNVKLPKAGEEGDGEGEGEGENGGGEHPHMEH